MADLESEIRTVGAEGPIVTGRLASAFSADNASSAGLFTFVSEVRMVQPTV